MHPIDAQDDIDFFMGRGGAGELGKEREEGNGADEARLEAVDRFGVVAKTFNELCNALSRFDEARNLCGKRARDLIEYEGGHSCEKYFDFI